MTEYEATFEHRPELSTTGGTEPNATCEDCGNDFYAYEGLLSVRDEILCNGCK